MDKLNHHEVINLLLQLGTMLLVARLLAEAARKLGQPAVVGEILAGVVLGPTLLGAVAPEVFDYLFPMEGVTTQVLDGFVQVAVVLLLFIAGLEVDLAIVIQQGKQALYTSLLALLIPLAVGFVFPWYFPDFFGIEDESQRTTFALFVATTMAITALPVIARVLMDLEIFKSRLGMLIIASAMIIDLLGWIIFTIILSMMGDGSSGSIWTTIGLTLGFTIATLTLGLRLLNRMLPWVNKKLAWPGGLLSISLVICFGAAALTEAIGIHSIFGAFIIGVALGDSEHLSERAKEILHQFINNIFAPLFFVSIGLYVNFFDSFNPLLVLVFVAIAFVGKTGGAFVGGLASGLGKVRALALGFGMNTHGTLEVILAAIALQAGLINDEIFVAILTMVVVSILTAAPLMRWLLKKDGG